MTKQEFLQKYLVKRRGTDCMKWDGMKEKFGEDDLLGMWVADMDFAVCDTIREALRERVDHGVFGYTVVPDRYYQTFSEWMEKHNHFPVKKEWMRFSQGCVTGIAWSIAAFTRPGDACMILTPVYSPFYNVVRNNHRKLVEVPLNYQDGYFTMNDAAIEKAIVENDVKMFIQCSPHNPIGRVWTEEELDRLFSICKKHHVLVVSDEIHQDLIVGDKTFLPAAAVSGGKYQDMVVMLNSATKAFNLAGLIHAHVVITSEKLREIYDRFAAAMNRTEISVMGMIATEAGYRHGEEWLNLVLEVIRDNYQYLKSALAEKLPKATVCCLEATYLPMVDLRAYIAPEHIVEVVQGKCRLGVDYGEWFGNEYKGFIRMNVATDPANVHTAVERLAKACVCAKQL